GPRGASRRGATTRAASPLPEAGLLRFRDPQKVKGLVGSGTALADQFLRIRVGGDLVLFQAIGALLLAWGAVDKSFVEQYTTGFGAYRDALADLDWARVGTVTGLTRDEIGRAYV